MNEILILGAGYTGMAATMGLAGRVKGRDDVQITLVNPQTRFTERLRLHQTASGQTLADLQIPDMLAGTGGRLRPGLGDAPSTPMHRPSGSTTRTTLRYDTLVYALGSVADTEAVPGVDEFAYTLNSAQDATLLAEHLDRLQRRHRRRGRRRADRRRVGGRDRRAASRTGRRPAESAGARIDDGRQGAGAAARRLGTPGGRRSGRRRHRQGDVGRRGPRRRRGGRRAGGAVDDRCAGLADRGRRRAAGRRARPDRHRRVTAVGVAPERLRRRRCRRRFGRATASCTAPARAASRPQCTPRLHRAGAERQAAQEVPLRLRAPAGEPWPPRRRHPVHSCRRHPGAVLLGRPVGRRVQRDGELQPVDRHTGCSRRLPQRWSGECGVAAADRRDERRPADVRRPPEPVVLDRLSDPRLCRGCRGRGPGRVVQVVGGRSLAGLRPEGLPCPDRVEPVDGAAAVHPASARNLCGTMASGADPHRDRCRRRRRRPPNRCRWRCSSCWRRSARWSARCSCSRRSSTSATPRSARP